MKLFQSINASRGAASGVVVRWDISKSLSPVSRLIHLVSMRSVVDLILFETAGRFVVHGSWSVCANLDLVPSVCHSNFKPSGVRLVNLQNRGRCRIPDVDNIGSRRIAVPKLTL